MWTEETFDALLQWFYKERTPYPFRRERTPYRVWISEVILQQTRIQAALDKLSHFLSRFPNLESLAKAKEEEVFAAFSGLGYYSRARNLQKGAQKLLKQYQGKFPKDVKELQKIPSIGPYTAAAIASICFGQPVPAVDGNVRRIFSRTEVWELPRDSALLQKKTEEYLKRFFPKLSYPAGDVNEALMELGEKICLPKVPRCEVCPIQRWCEGKQKGKAESLPLSKKKKPFQQVVWQMFFLEREGYIALEEWKNFYFFKGHLSFPSRLYFLEQNQWLYSHPFVKELTGNPLPVFSHTITHHKIQVQPFWTSPPQDFPSHLLWIPKEQVGDKLVPSVLKKGWEVFLKKGPVQTFFFF